MKARGTPEGDAERILKNLEYIEKAWRLKRGADVHVVTHRMMSLLGLLVVRRDGLDSAIELRSLAQLPDGWPGWEITLDTGKKKTETLGDLLSHFRNALAHGRFFPDLDSLDPEEVTVIFQDAPSGDAPVYWEARLSAVDLLAFCKQLGVLIKATGTP